MAPSKGFLCAMSDLDQFLAGELGEIAQGG